MSTGGGERWARYKRVGNIRDKKLPEAQPGTNPLNKFGKRTKCVICKSVFHCVKDCFHKSESINGACSENVQYTDDQSEYETCHITLFMKLSDCEIFMSESFVSVVIDTTCTVFGQKWLDDKMNRLSPTLKISIISSKCLSDRCFRFADGTLVPALHKVTVLTWIDFLLH